MRNPLHIGPEKTRKILLLGDLQFPSGDGAGALAGMPAGDTQSCAHRS